MPQDGWDRASAHSNALKTDSYIRSGRVPSVLIFSSLSRLAVMDSSTELFPLIHAPPSRRRIGGFPPARGAWSKTSVTTVASSPSGMDVAPAVARGNADLGWIITLSPRRVSGGAGSQKMRRSASDSTT